MPPSQPNSRRTTVPILVLATLAIALLAWLTFADTAPGETRTPTADAPIAAAVAATTASAAARDASVTAPMREAAAQPLDGDDMTFAQRVEELVEIGKRTTELARQDATAEAEASDKLARERFAALMQRFDDAGAQALHFAVGLPAAASDPNPLSPVQKPKTDETLAHRFVLHLVLAEDLARRHEQGVVSKDRSRVDALTQAVLDSMPATAITLELGARTLVEKPYMHLVHEPAVLGLLRLANDGKFPRRLATQLLTTLWDNLLALNERSSDELSRLALMELGTKDPSQRAAACRQLLADPRYRALVLAWLREHKDDAVALDVCERAAMELEPKTALLVLRELAPLLQSAPNAYLVVAFRAPEAVADAYRELLSSDTQPQIRADLITGVGMADTPLGQEMAQLALDNDPSADVRLRAMLALSTRRQPGVAERAIQQVLDDPRVAKDPSRLASVVHALENLEAGGDLNVIQRLGEQLKQTPLASYSREKLDLLLARALPGGAPR